MVIMYYHGTVTFEFTEVCANEEELKDIIDHYFVKGSGIEWDYEIEEMGEIPKGEYREL